MATDALYRCQCTDDGRALCSTPAAVRVVEVDSETGKELRQTAAYACLEHSASLAFVIAEESTRLNKTVRMIELPGMKAQLEARDGNR